MNQILIPPPSFSGRKAPVNTGASRAVRKISSAVAVVRTGDGRVDARVVDNAVGLGGAITGDEKLIALLPPLHPEWLGDPEFRLTHSVRFAYVVGEMARGIATARMTVAAVRAGVMGFFGSAGLRLDEIEAAIHEIKAALGPDTPGWGANLIHNPYDLEMEMATIDLFLALGVRNVSASAFMRLSPAIVAFAAKGLRRGAGESIVRPHAVFAKVSRAEVARPFMSPAPEAMLRALVSAGRLTPDEAALAARIPVAGDITAEADSGGHTDNRPLTVLLPLLQQVRDEAALTHGFAPATRIGAAGGLGTPAALAAAFAAGAAYVVTGSINQCTVESGLSEDARALLAAAEPTDVAMAPAADMFEMGVKVQVLKRGTLFAQRGQRLYELYRRYDSLQALPADERTRLEREILGRTIDEVWDDTAAHFSRSKPSEIERAHSDPKHKMALVFRWYLFMGAQWAREGVTARRADYQVWCGPAMGAFNAWAKNTPFAKPQARQVGPIAHALLAGAAMTLRAQALRLAGVVVPSGADDIRPLLDAGAQRP
jgi:PfaD family protein